jgi:hypothetical protein
MYDEPNTTSLMIKNKNLFKINNLYNSILRALYFMIIRFFLLQLLTCPKYILQFEIKSNNFGLIKVNKFKISIRPTKIINKTILFFYFFFITERTMVQSIEYNYLHTI